MKSPPLKFRMRQSTGKKSGGVFSSFNKTNQNFTSPINFKMREDQGWAEKEKDPQALTWSNRDIAKLRERGSLEPTSEL